MTEKQHVSYEDITKMTEQLIADIEATGWEPEIIVGMVPHGLLPAVILSHHFDCPMQPLVWNVDNKEEQESNCWLAEDAVAGKHTLIVDATVRTGRTIEQVTEDWDMSVFNNIAWGESVKSACLFLAEDSEVKPEFVAERITNTQTQVYPWEGDK